MLIVRDLLVGPRRYTDLKQGLPRIPTNILSTRLKELQEGGVVRRVPLMNCGLVYELTALRPAARADRARAGRWGFAQMGEPGPGRRRDGGLAHDGAADGFPGGCRGRAAAGRLRGARRRRRAARAGRRRRRLRIAQLAPPAPPVGGSLPAGEPELVFAAGPGIRHIISGELTPAEAIDQDVLAVVAGDATLLERFAATFHIDLADAAALAA